MERQSLSKIEESGSAASPPPQLAAFPSSQGLQEELEGLPRSYGRTNVVLMTVNPYLVHAYWEVVPRDLEKIKELHDPQAQPALRFYDVTGISFDGSNARHCFDIDIQLSAENWYVHLWSPAKSYVVDVGLRAADGRFFTLARSNVAHTPPAAPSMRMDAQHLPVPLGSKVQERRAVEPPAREPHAAITPGNVLREREGQTPGGDRPVAAIDMARTVHKKLAGLYRRLLRIEPGDRPKPATDSSGARPSTRTSQPGEYSATAPRTAGTGYADLTQMNEDSFISGVSSR